MKKLARVVLAAVASVGLCSLAHAKVQISVDLDSQTMHVDGGGKSYDWKVSSGATGHATPNGNYGVLWTDDNHFSDEYDGAPMPHAIFFAPGYAIHGAYKSRWGHPASHGCIRLPVDKAAILFKMVQAEGAKISIIGGSEASTQAALDLKTHAADAGPAVLRGEARDDRYVAPDAAATPAQAPGDPYYYYGGPPRAAPTYDGPLPDSLY